MCVCVCVRVCTCVYVYVGCFSQPFSMLEQIGGRTPIGLGLDTSRGLLEADVARSQALPTIILLTDGVASENPQPAADRVRGWMRADIV
jgi:hypothetical protein